MLDSRAEIRLHPLGPEEGERGERSLNSVYPVRSSVRYWADPSLLLHFFSFCLLSFCSHCVTCYPYACSFLSAISFAWTSCTVGLCVVVEQGNGLLLLHLEAQEMTFVSDTTARSSAFFLEAPVNWSAFVDALRPLNLVNFHLSTLLGWMEQVPTQDWGPGENGSAVVPVVWRFASLDTPCHCRRREKKKSIVKTYDESLSYYSAQLFHIEVM